MPTEQTLAIRLQHIQETGAKIQAIIRRTTEDQFLNIEHPDEYAAVCYFFVLIAEAVIAIDRHYPTAARSISQIPDIVSFRNHLTHRYYNIEPHLVWLAARQPLSQLLAEVQAIQANQPTG